MAATATTIHSYFRPVAPPTNVLKLGGRKKAKTKPVIDLTGDVPVDLPEQTYVDVLVLNPNDKLLKCFILPPLPGRAQITLVIKLTGVRHTYSETETAFALHFVRSSNLSLRAATQKLVREHGAIFPDLHDRTIRRWIASMEGPTQELAKGKDKAVVKAKATAAVATTAHHVLATDSPHAAVATVAAKKRGMFRST